MPSFGLISVLLLVPLANAAPLSAADATEYLQSFGYIQPARLMADGSSGEAVEDQETQERNALRKFQAVAGIAQTGKLDEATKEKMRAPRCGLPDVASYSTGEEVDWKWDKKALTYSIDNSGSGMTDAQTRNAIRSAFAVFAAVTPLTFKEVATGHSDMKILFTRGRHGCYSRFDGKGNVVGHAYYPDDGRIHFDADESWTVMSSQHLPVYTHTDFYGTAIHEIGHALGLEHVLNDATSIMAPVGGAPRDKNGNYEAPRLDRQLIATLHKKYGTPSTPTGDGGGGGQNNKHCLNHVYAALSLPKNRIVLFTDKGKRMVVFSTVTKKAIMNVPIENVFSSGPSFAAAGYFNSRDSFFMLFQGNRMWRYNFANNKVSIAHGYPKRLPGVGDDWHTGAAMYSHPERTLINYEKKVAFYDEKENSLRMAGHISTVYPNMPEFVAGVADINGDGTYVGFTEANVFEYDYTEETSQHLGTIGDFLLC